MTARIVFTDSEPDRGSEWLVANHVPHDRARFSCEITVAAGEDAVANGERKAGAPAVSYALADPIPTYLMAFAAGQLEHVDRAGDVPLAVWYRRGLVFDAQGQLDAMAGPMATFVSLLGPYPFDRYAVVLVPELGGGMENATITFNDETSAQGLISVNLNAHELAHQWFGDWVTIESFDDLWIKEGMATLLAAEATRATRDGENRGRYFGFDFAFNPAHAMVDTSLVGLARYTSGPYARAAWTLTQLRFRMGDPAFFGALRGVLSDHALGTIDSAAFLAVLHGEDVRLEGKGAPELTVTQTGEDVTLSLDDEGHALLVPIGVTVVDAAGGATTSELAAGATKTVRVPSGGYLALDERDVHPDPLDVFTVTGAGALAALRSPGEGAIAAWASRSAGHEERSLARAGLPPGGAAAFAGLYAQLDSPLARRYAEVLGCRALRAAPEGWPEVLAPVMRAPAQPIFTTGYAACGQSFAASTLGAELTALAADPTAAGATRLAFVMSFDFGPAASFTALSKVAVMGSGVELRDQAIARLSYQAAGGFGYSAVPEDQKPAWRTFFRERLPETTSGTRLMSVWRGVRGLADEGALSAVAGKMATVLLSAESETTIVCQAHGFASPAARSAFKSALATAQISDTARMALNNPEGCQ